MNHVDNVWTNNAPAVPLQQIFTEYCKNYSVYVSFGKSCLSGTFDRSRLQCELRNCDADHKVRVEVNLTGKTGDKAALSLS